VLLSGARRRSARSVVFSGARRRTAPAATWRRSVACGSAALGCARWHSAALGGPRRPQQHGGARRPQQHGGARQHSCPGQFRCAVKRADTGARWRAVALGGTPYLEVRTSPVARHAAASPQALQCRSRASPGRRSLFPSLIFGSAPMHGSWVRSLRGPRVRSLRGPRVRSHARSSGPFP
jgi:hypothetical protein